MSPPNESTPELTQKITDLLTKVLVTGSGGFTLYYLVANDIAKAVIAGVVAFGASLMTNFWEGFGGRLNPRAKTVGEEAGKLVEQKITGIADRFSDFPSLYREALKTYCYSVEIEGLQTLPGIALRDVYVPLRIESEENRFILETPKDIWHFLPKTAHNFPHRRIAVVAAPGYGKTTLMRYLAYIFLTQPPKNTPFSLPILLRFREIYVLIRPIPENLEKILTLSDLILQHFAKQAEFQTLKPSRQWLEENLKQGKCLVMLDGLDEVPKAQQQAVREWTDKQMKAYHNTQFILTSRPHGFEIKALSVFCGKM